MALVLLCAPLPVFPPCTDTCSSRGNTCSRGVFPSPAFAQMVWISPTRPPTLSPFTQPHSECGCCWPVAFTLVTKEIVLWLGREQNCGQWKESPLKPSQASITPLISDEGREQRGRGTHALRERGRPESEIRHVSEGTTLCKRALQAKRKQRSLLVEHLQARSYALSHTFFKAHTVTTPTACM